MSLEMALLSPNKIVITLSKHGHDLHIDNPIHPPVDISSPQTLKELDLDSILRNPRLCLFIVTGQTLKSRCAPMRDRTDIANHQLRTFRPYLGDISSSHLGHCFDQGSDDDNEKWAKIRQDIVLQIAMRAKETSQLWLDPQPASLASAPVERVLKLAERWYDLNMRPNSPLSTMLRNRIRNVIFNKVVALTFPSRDSITSLGKPLDSASAVPPALASGMELLANDIRLLSERLSRLAHIHLGVYLPLYEQEDFSSSIFLG
ncbi:hypothetical protein DFH29DRAFT_1078217 [Suillus ampliporus]|nr:hypothetical protein DFH29DRAFT_1078217 [Suillus ampliporus]